MIFQEPMTSLNPVYQVGHQVEEVLLKNKQLNAKERTKMVLRIFKEMGIHDPEHCYYSYPHQLSGGLRQRIMIAMAMITKPDLLIADEPTTSLDVTIQLQILTQLHLLKETYGTSILLITHDLGIVANYCDYVYVMYKGQIVEHGETKHIIARPSHPYTKQLIQARLTIPAQGYVPAAESTKNIFTNEPILKICDLYKEYSNDSSVSFLKGKSLPANRNINLSLYPGEILAIVGESGSGKSTLGYQIAGLLQPNSGKIFYKGTEITSLPQKERRRLHKEIQIVFQDPLASLDPHMDVYHIIEEPLLVYNLYPDKKEREHIIYQMMAQVGIEKELSHRLPSQLSGGQRQRIGIARALIINPSIIVWDEPVSALDVLLEQQIIDLIQKLRKLYGFSSIFITHDMAVVYHLAHRACVMNQGEIVEIATKEQLFTNPKSEYTKQLLDSIL